MLPTYEAVLKGNQLEWRREVPPRPNGEDEVVVLVTIVKNERQVSRKTDSGQRIAEILEKLAAIHLHENRVHES